MNFSDTIIGSCYLQIPDIPSAMFKTRSQQKEMLDETNIDPITLHQNLNEFSLINQYLGSKTSLLDSLNQVYLKNKQDCLNRKIRIADLGCGAADLLLAIQQWAIEKNIHVELVGIDCNPDIIEFAKKAVHPYPNIQILQLDIFEAEFQNLHFDIVCLNNVCHHFSDEELISLLKKLKSQTNMAIIINDLRRVPIAFYSIKWMSKLFRFSNLAQNDGPLSVLKSFKKQDFDLYLTKAEISIFEIQKKWAFRWLVIIYPRLNV